jgi:hypothetical protein
MKENINPIPMLLGDAEGDLLFPGVISLPSAKVFQAYPQFH